MAQLRAMAMAARRIEGRDALTTMHAVYAAVAACWCPKGAQVIRKTQKAFEKQASGEE